MDNNLIYIIDIIIILIMIYIISYLERRDKLSMFNYDIYIKLLSFYIFPIVFVIINIIMNIIYDNKLINYIITTLPILVPIISIIMNCIKFNNIDKMNDKYSPKITNIIEQYFNSNYTKKHLKNIRLFFRKEEYKYYCRVIINISNEDIDKINIKHDIQEILSNEVSEIEFYVVVK